MAPHARCLLSQYFAILLPSFVLVLSLTHPSLVSFSANRCRLSAISRSVGCSLRFSGLSASSSLSVLSCLVPLSPAADERMQVLWLLCLVCMRIRAVCLAARVPLVTFACRFFKPLSVHYLCPLAAPLTFASTPFRPAAAGVIVLIWQQCNAQCISQPLLSLSLCRMNARHESRGVILLCAACQQTCCL